jgi:hypothetical protein
LTASSVRFHSCQCLSSSARHSDSERVIACSGGGSGEATSCSSGSEIRERSRYSSSSAIAKAERYERKDRGPCKDWPACPSLAAPTVSALRSELRRCRPPASELTKPWNCLAAMAIVRQFVTLGCGCSMPHKAHSAPDRKQPDMGPPRALPSSVDEDDHPVIARIRPAVIILSSALRDGAIVLSTWSRGFALQATTFARRSHIALVHVGTNEGPIAEYWLDWFAGASFFPKVFCL